MKSTDRQAFEQFKMQLEECTDDDQTFIASIGYRLCTILQPKRRDALNVFMSTGPREAGSTRRKLLEIIGQELAAEHN